MYLGGTVNFEVKNGIAVLKIDIPDAKVCLIKYTLYLLLYRRMFLTKLLPRT